MSEAVTSESASGATVSEALSGAQPLRQRLEEWLAPAREADAGASVHALLLGLRRFDAINLSYGPAAGDLALAEVAGRLSHFAAQELNGRFLSMRSGGAFLLVSAEACSRERWQLFAGQLADAVARPIVLPSGVLRLSPRLALLRGLAGEACESMLDRLSQALTSAKRQQGRRIAWADGEETRPGRTAAQLESDLFSAIDGDQIEIFYQPQFSLTDGALSGAEALARWNHPRLGRMGAAALFAIAERADHLEPLSRHIARLAMIGAAGWHGDLRMSLNVTSSDLAVASYKHELLAVAEECDFAPGRLTLEVTEQAILTDIGLAAETLASLSETGVRIALDDFGAGFCNFRYLKLLPLHYLKLDRSMVEGITSDPRDLAVLRGIVAMARALDLQVIAEGIETEAQRALAAQEGCAFYQGYLGAWPMNSGEFQAMATR